MMGIDTAKSVGNYDLLEKIAEGGMGAIYRGRHRESGQIVAIKIMPPHMAQNPVLLKRFEQEFRAASRLDHPNIVRALDYGDNGNTPYLVMEFVDGESLGQKIEREGRMPETEAIRIIAQVAQGLHRAHKQNLVHRDVKPDNILVTPDGIAKLADLGLVKETETRPEPDQDRPRPGHAALHGPRAVPQRQERRHPLRHLQPRRHPLPDGHRRVAVPLQRPARRLDEEDPERADAAASAGAGACPSASTGPSGGP